MVDKEMKGTIDSWDKFASEIIDDSGCTDPMLAILVASKRMYSGYDDFDDGMAGGLLLAYMIIKHCESKVN